jgi:hypothetical protein
MSNKEIEYIIAIDLLTANGYIKSTANVYINGDDEIFIWKSLGDYYFTGKNNPMVDEVIELDNLQEYLEEQKGDIL